MKKISTQLDSGDSIIIYEQDGNLFLIASDNYSQESALLHVTKRDLENLSKIIKEFV